MTKRIIAFLIALMGFVHIGATFSPLISGKLAVLDTNTYQAMIYMSLMCGLLLVALGNYIAWAISYQSNCSALMFPRKDFEQMISRKLSYPDALNGTMELSFDVPTFADVDKEYTRAISLGAKGVFVPTTEPWGQRTYYIADPEGNLIEI